jgi:hypothetical protein
MRQAWKSPKILRLKKIEDWRRARFERAILGRDQVKAFRAAELYTAVAARAQSPHGMVSTFSSRD